MRIAAPSGPAADFAAFVLAFVAAAALRQETFYSADGRFFLLALRNGDHLLPHHVAWMPIVRVAADLLAPLGVGTHAVASWVSVVAFAIGIGFAHAAFRSWFDDRRRAVLATSLVATTPSLSFFASVVELHAVQFAFAGPAFLAAVGFARRPSTSTGLWLGASTGLAALGHATSALLPTVLLPLAFVLARERCRDRDALQRALVVAVGATGLASVSVALAKWAIDESASPGAAIQFAVGHHFDDVVANPWLVLRAFGVEFGLGYFACSALVCFGVFRAHSRAAGIALLPGTLLLSIATAVLLGAGTERGAYFAQFAVAYGLVAATAVTDARALSALALASAAVAIGAIAQHDRGLDRTYASAFAEERGDARVVLVAGAPDEVGALLLDDERGSWIVVTDLLAIGEAEVAAAAAVAVTEDELRKGGQLWLTTGACHWLEDDGTSGSRAIGRRVLAALRERFDFVPRRRLQFSALELRPRTSPTDDRGPR